MDTHDTITPDESDRDFYLEAEHIWKYIIWKLVKKEANCIMEIFRSVEVFFNEGSYPAQELLLIGVFGAISKEGQKFGMEFSSDLEPFLTTKTRALWKSYYDDPSK